MPVITCDHCGRQIKASGNLSGKKVRCPSCVEIFTVPGADAVPASKEPIVVECKCGNAWEVSHDIAGKRILCAACDEPVIVPRPPVACPSCGQRNAGMRLFCSKCNHVLKPEEVAERNAEREADAMKRARQQAVAEGRPLCAVIALFIDGEPAGARCAHCKKYLDKDWGVGKKCPGCGALWVKRASHTRASDAR